jgi:endo-beta-N-acetylglucosaminidase D
MFATPEAAASVAAALVDIATDFGIDGWLINIENRLDIDIVVNVQLFLRELSAGMHGAFGAEAKVIW